MNNLISNILDTDSYKLSQYLQYPQNMTNMYSYFESRGGKFGETLFFGLQYILKHYLSKPVTQAQVEEAREFAKKHGTPFNYDGWTYIVKNLNGVLPVVIKAVPEGTVVPAHNILMSIESTDENVSWIVNWLETMLVRCWYPISVATLSYQCKKMIMRYEDLSVDEDKISSDILFKLNDFGSRGSSSRESASIGGAAHLVNFLGSDTIAGAYLANQYYNCDMSAFSIEASEHSTVTSWGKENEVDMMRNMLNVFKDSPLMACVSDSYDYKNCVDNIWGKELKEMVESSNGVRICRPDSGNPTDCVLYALNSFANSYGYTLNSKGFKVLNKMRIIQGDGMSYDAINEMMNNVVSEGFSVENVNVGMGGGLLQKYVDRDTHKFAFKCSWIKFADGTERDVYKQPKTDSGKNSKRGRLALVIDSDRQYKTVKESETTNDILTTVYKDGIIVKEYSFDEVRKNTGMW